MGTGHVGPPKPKTQKRGGGEAAMPHGTGDWRVGRLTPVDDEGVDVVVFHVVRVA